MGNFNAEQAIENITTWIRKYFEENASPTTKAVIGIYGGNDSSVASALCVRALGKERVIGVLMPQGEQADIEFSKLLVKTLDIQNYIINIGESVNSFMTEIRKHIEPSGQAIVNTPARIRMTTLYAVAATVGGRVVNTCNLSEDWVGNSTRYGDSAGDFSPLSELTVTEVKLVGKAAGLPAEFIDKVPSDGLCGKSDEDNLGFSYEVLDRYIRTGEIEDAVVKEKIDRLYEKNLFKLQLMPKFTEEQNEL